MIIAARAVQGAFGAVLISSTKSLLVTVYSDEDERAKVMGVFTATLCRRADRPRLGRRAHQRAELALVPLREHRRLARHASRRSAVAAGSPGHKEVKIDLWSALLASVGMAALVYALGEAVWPGGVPPRSSAP